MVFTFIVNPHAGGGLFKRSTRRFLHALEASNLTFDLVQTEYPGHAVELARSAAERSDVVVAVGGDGTVSEVVSGIVQSGRGVHLAVVPIGTGNDFAKMLLVPKDPERILLELRAVQPTRADFGRVRWEGPGGGGEGVFINAAGTGIDAKVAAAASKMTFLGGTPRYVAAVFRTLRHWTAPEVSISIERCGRVEDLSPGPHLLILAGNGRCAAGGFFLTPDARIEDGLLDACVIRNAPLSRILKLIPDVLRGGRHASAPEVLLTKADKIHVYSKTPLAIQADGEALTSEATDIVFEIVAGGISLAQHVKP